MDNIIINKEKEENLIILKQLETKGAAFDILTRANFLLNATESIQPKILTKTIEPLVLEYNNFIASIYINDIHLIYNGIEEVYDDDAVIVRIKELIM